MSKIKNKVRVVTPAEQEIGAFNLSNIKTSAELQAIRRRKIKKKQKEEVNKVSFDDYWEIPGNYEDVKPLIYFFKFLAWSPDDIQLAENQLKEGKAKMNPRKLNSMKLKLWLPDTIVFGDASISKMWFYTGEDGYVYRTDHFTAKHIVAKLGNYSSPDELVAVMKQAHYHKKIITNDLKLVSTRDLSQMTPSLIQGARQQVLQKFVKSTGPKAFICRTHYIKNGEDQQTVKRRKKKTKQEMMDMQQFKQINKDSFVSKAPSVHIITNKSSFYERDHTLKGGKKIPELQLYTTYQSKKLGSCNIISSYSGIYLKQTLYYIKNLLKYLKINTGIEFEEIICDFIKDEAGTWWLVNVKSFIIIQTIPHTMKDIYANDKSKEFHEKKNKKFSISGHQKIALCKYCQIPFKKSELTHKMTLKMVIQTDLHLQHRGLGQKWLNRLNLKNIDSSMLYQSHPVCDCCYWIYEYTDKLREIQYKFAKKLGINVTESAKSDLISILNFTDYEGNQRYKMPEEWSGRTMKPNQSIIPQQFILIQKIKSDSDFQKFWRYRIMFLFQHIRDVPTNVDITKSHYIEYQIFNQRKIRYKLNFDQPLIADNMIPLKKLKIAYFFAENREGVQQFIEKQKTVEIRLYCERKKIGTVHFDIMDFLSEKVSKRQFQKVFSGKDINPVLSWRLKLIFGISKSVRADSSPDENKIDCSRIKLAKYNGILIPPDSYYTCEALPPEWYSQIKNVKEHGQKQPQSPSRQKQLLQSQTPYSNYANQQVTLDETEKIHPIKKTDIIDQVNESFQSAHDSVQSLMSEKVRNRNQKDLVQQMLMDEISFYDNANLTKKQKKVRKKKLQKSRKDQESSYSQEAMDENQEIELEEYDQDLSLNI